MTVFVCNLCREVLTHYVVEVSFAELAAPKAPCDLARGEQCPPWLVRGTFAVNPHPYGPPYVPEPGDRFLISAGPVHTILLNPDDLLVARRPHPEPRRSSGCCGPSGDDGPNLLCTCGAEIATESADCWTPQVLYLGPDAIGQT